MQGGRSSRWELGRHLLEAEAVAPPPSWYIHQQRVWIAPFAYGGPAARQPATIPARGYHGHPWVSAGTCCGMSFVHISIVITSFCPVLIYHLMVAIQRRNANETGSLGTSFEKPNAERHFTACITDGKFSLREWWLEKWSALLKDIEAELSAEAFGNAPYSQGRTENDMLTGDKPDGVGTEMLDEEQHSRFASPAAELWHYNWHGESNAKELGAASTSYQAHQASRERWRWQGKSLMWDGGDSGPEMTTAADNAPRLGKPPEAGESQNNGLGGGDDGDGSGGCVDRDARNTRKMTTLTSASSGDGAKTRQRRRYTKGTVGGVDEGDKAERPGRRAQDELAPGVMVRSSPITILEGTGTCSKKGTTKGSLGRGSGRDGRNMQRDRGGTDETSRKRASLGEHEAQRKQQEVRRAYRLPYGL